MKKTFFQAAAATLLSTVILLGSALTAYAEPIDYNALQEQYKTLPVQTNEIPGWPQGPVVSARSAILMDADSGAILYAKGIDEKHFPASTTKIMTCLLAIENSELDEMVTFSHEAVFSIERGSSNIGMDEGESITMNEALHGILILSANEVANAVGEHVAGDAQSFVDMMNAKAEELGCTNTHFMNAHGLHNDEHYTTARDLATIARAFFSYDVLAKISGTTYCTFEATATQPDSFCLATKNQLVEGKEYEYEWLVGSKTGYTTQARQTLVSCAKRDGMKLICVVFVEESPNQFIDTINLFNYGFENFHRLNIAQNETGYTMENNGFLESGSDIFGNSKPFMSLADDTYVIVPNSVNFEDLSSRLVYDTEHSDSVAKVQYFYHDDVYVGETYVKISGQTPTMFYQTPDASAVEPNTAQTIEPSTQQMLLQDASQEPATEAPKPITNKDDNNIFINIKIVIIAIVILAVLVIGVLFFRTISENFYFAKRRYARKRRKRNRTRYDSSEFKNIKF